MRLCRRLLRRRSVPKERPQPLLTSHEVAELLHVHVNTVKRLGDRGHLPFVRVSTRGDRRYHPKDIADMLERLGARR